MKFTCDQKVLSSALATVGRAVSARTTLPITQGIKMLAEPGKVTLTGTNLDITIEQTIMTNVEEPGEAVVMGGLFLDIVRRMPEAPIEIELNGDKVLIKAMGSKFNLVCFNPDEFPVISDDVGNAPIKLDKDTFISMIKETIFATSNEESKGVLTGILVDVEGGIMTLVAVDGFRLATRTEPVNISESFKVVIPGKTMDELSRINNDATEMHVSLGSRFAVFTVGDVKIHTRLMTDDFVDWRKLIPQSHEMAVAANLETMVQSLDRAALFAEGKNGLVKLDIDKDVVITSQSEEGNVREVIPADIQGGELTIGFNVKYVLDAMKAIDDEDIRIEFTDSLKPAVVKPVDGDRFLYLLLPVRTR